MDKRQPLLSTIQPILREMAAFRNPSPERGSPARRRAKAIRQLS
jgi:hypothetical protein